MINKIKWLFTIALVLSFLYICFYDRTRRTARISNAIYTKGISSGIIKGAKGSSFLDYTYKIGDSTYYGNVTVDFYNECQKCCIKGDTVFVRFEKNNPINSDLVVTIPKDSHFQ